MDKLPDIKIGGRMIPLFYSTLEMVQIQEDPLGLGKKIHGIPIVK